MKPIFHLSYLFLFMSILQPCNAQEYSIMNQWTMGEWFNKADNATLVLQPKPELDTDKLYNSQTGQWSFPESNKYQIGLNGQTPYSDTYWVNGTTMNLNNYITFEILGLDENNLYIRDSFGGANAQIIHLTRVGSKPNSSQAQTQPSTSNTTHVLQLNLQKDAPNFRKYQKNASNVLASTNGMSLTEGDFQKSLEVWEYVIGEAFTDADLQAERQRTIAQFKADPTQTLQNIEANQQTMQQLYQLKNPAALGVARAAIAYGVTSNPQLPNAKEDIAIFNKYDTVLAVDAQNGVALLEKDLQGLLKTIEFVNKISNPSFKMDAATQQTFRQNTIQNYPNLSIEEKQSIASMHITYQMLAAEWSGMNNQEKQEAAQKMIAENGGTSTNVSGGSFESAKANLYRILSKGKSTGDSSSGMNWNTYQTMSNMSLQNHASMLNSISAIGGSGDYWSVR
ncbi:MAG: hypothetical protein ACPGVB_16150, partial [Chitinophagales bacterium]